jgi:hypothetical protein
VSRRRLVAAIFFSAVILAVLGVIVGAEVVSGGETVSVLRMSTSVQQGALFSPSDVDVVALRIAPGDLNYEAPGSVPSGSRFAIALQSGDLLQPDDLVSGDVQIPITLTLTDAPPLQVGEAIDLFANAPGTGTEVLIGHDLTVEATSGSSVTVLVNRQNELAWLEILAFNSELKLYALASVAAPPSGLAPADIDQALCQLAPADCSELAVPASSGTPQASVSAVPGASASPMTASP